MIPSNIWYEALRDKALRSTATFAQFADRTIANADHLFGAAVRKAMLDLSAAERKAALIEETAKKQADVLKLIDDRIKAGAASALTSPTDRKSTRLNSSH